MKLVLKNFLILASLIFPFLANSQTEVSGTVADENSDPMIGVTIMEKGTTNGTITDIDGQFSLKTSTDDPTLIFSFIGYKSREYLVTESSPINLAMEVDAATLDEVIVVGYGTQKKKVVTGAIAKVNGTELEDMQLSRVESALKGRTSGVRVTQDSGQPGSGSTVRIRGTTTLGNNDPLYIVDGVIVGGGIDFLNQNDIESIEVLKDAASASIYGTQAANGVILITTKKGVEGKPTIQYNAFYSVSNPWKKLSVLNAFEYATLMNESFAASGLAIPFEDPSIYGEGTDWQDAIFRKNAPAFNHNISISGGGEKSSYYASFSILDEQGTISDDKSSYQRYNFRINNDNKISEKIRIGTTIGYAKVQSRGVTANSEWGSPLGRAINLDPITPLYETDPNVLSTDLFTSFPVVGDDNGVFGISPYVTSEILNPVAALSVQDNIGWSDKIVASGYLEVKPIKNLTLRSSIGTDIAFWGDENFTPVHYLNATNRRDLNSYGRGQNRGFFWIWENTASYKLNFGLNSLTALVGTSAQKNKGQGIGGSIQDIPVVDLESASLAFSTTPESQVFSGFEYESRVSSIFGRLFYNFNEKYLLTATIRRDGSTRFGSNNRYGIFPSVSLGWVLSDESFFNVRPINFFKFRASWGVNGNDRIDDFAFLPLVNTGSNYTFGLDDNLAIGVSPNSLSNPDLRWEETTQINVGFDAVLFKNVDLTFDVYQKNTTGILRSFELPSYVGFGPPVANVGEAENKGFEIELNYGNSAGAFTYEIGGNLSYNENKITFITPDTEFIPGATFGPSGVEMTRTIVGHPIGSFFGHVTDGIFQNEAEIQAYTDAEGELIQPDAQPGDFKFVDLNNDGVISDEDRQIIGDPTPKWTYGVPINLSYKNFDLIIFGQGVWGNQVFQATRRFDLQMANLTGDALERWTGEGTSTEHPRLTAVDNNKNYSRSSAFYIEDGSFFRLKNVQLGYTLPQHLTQKAFIQKAKVYVAVNNALTFTKYSGFDPEVGGDSFGIDRGVYPNSKSFVVGANITF